jgi:enterochelin esterase-like enzyme
MKLDRLLHQQLLENNIAHDYEEFEEAQERVYWREHVIDSILFFSRYFYKEKM